MKELSNSIMNQANYWNDCAKDKVVDIRSANIFDLDFQKNIIRQNPMNSMQYNWQIAQLRKNFVFWSTIPFVISETFWTTFMQVYTPEGKE